PGLQLVGVVDLDGAGELEGVPTDALRPELAQALAGPDGGPEVEREGCQTGRGVDPVFGDRPQVVDPVVRRVARPADGRAIATDGALERCEHPLEHDLCRRVLPEAPGRGEAGDVLPGEA